MTFLLDVEENSEHSLHSDGDNVSLRSFDGNLKSESDSDFNLDSKSSSAKSFDPDKSNGTSVASNGTSVASNDNELKNAPPEEEVIKWPQQEIRENILTHTVKIKKLFEDMLLEFNKILSSLGRQIANKQTHKQQQITSKNYTEFIKKLDLFLISTGEVFAELFPNTTSQTANLKTSIALDSIQQKNEFIRRTKESFQECLKENTILALSLKDKVKTHNMSSLERVLYNCQDLMLIAKRNFSS